MSQFATFYMTPSLSPIKAYSGVYATTREPPNEPPSSDASMLTLYSTSCDVVRMDGISSKFRGEVSLADLARGARGTNPGRHRVILHSSGLRNRNPSQSPASVGGAQRYLIPASAFPYGAAGPTRRRLEVFQEVFDPP